MAMTSTVTDQVVTFQPSADFETGKEIIAWFKPASPQDVIDSAVVLKAAYEKALESHKELTKGRHKSDFPSLTDKTSLEDVLQAVVEAEKKYGAKKESRWRFTKAVTSGWSKTVNRINVFSGVIDTLVSSHPEYAALVWGTIRFLVTVTLNHQELSSKISDAFSAISDALPEVSFLAHQLYPIPNIQHTLAVMYTHIIDFCIRALQWYRKVTKGFFRKAWAAVKDPWVLEFDDVVRKIEASNRRIREQAQVAHQAETRFVSNMMAEVRMEVKGLRRTQAPEFTPENIHAILNTEFFKQPAKLLGSVFIPEKMARYFLSIPFKPEKAFTIGTALRDRRRARNGPNPDAERIWKSPKLREWISEPRSALVQLQGSIIQTDISRDFGLDIVDLTKQTGLPVAWYLGSPLPSSDEKGTMKVTDILRSLVHQILHGYKERFADSHLEEKDFASCRTDDDWIRLLVGVASQLPRLALIIDAHSHTSQMLETVRKFWDALEASKTQTIVKMLLLTYSLSGTATPVFLKSERVLFRSMTLGQDRRPGMMRAALAGKVKARRMGGKGGGSGPGDLRPFMVRLLEAG